MSMAEFERDFPAEGQYVEFKRGIGKEPLQDTIVAFSNADGGVILIGVEDDGTIAGRSLEPGTEDAIYEIARNVHSPGRYSLHQVEVDGKALVAISIAKREEGFCQASNGRGQSPPGDPRRVPLWIRSPAVGQRALHYPL